MPPEVPSGPDLLYGLMLLAGIIILITAFLRIPRVRRQKMEARKRALPDASGGAGLKRTMDELVVSLHEMSRELNAQLDTKMRAIDTLLRKSEEVTTRLEAALAEAERPNGQSGANAARYDDIYRMADQGMTATEIARAKGLQPGEIELILNLRRKRT